MENETGKRVVIENLKAYAGMYRDWGMEGVSVHPPRAGRDGDGGIRSSSGDMEELRVEMGDCSRCKLHAGRKNIVFGSGNPKADLMFVGEGPGEEEDRQGLPFVGKAGQLLTRIIEAMGLGRDEVYIANIIKCRPPRNRNPEPDEIDACIPFLEGQIARVSPRVICALGAFAAQTLLATDRRISGLRGRFHPLARPAGLDIKVMPTFHPAYLLRNPQDKKKVWEDVQLIMEDLCH
ncbi:MAG TPA: uracil-DNA glycosylase [Nitrospiria bacterium]